MTWRAIFRRLCRLVAAEWSWRRGVRLPECACGAMLLGNGPCCDACETVRCEEQARVDALCRPSTSEYGWLDERSGVPIPINFGVSMIPSGGFGYSMIPDGLDYNAMPSGLSAAIDCPKPGRTLGALYREVTARMAY